MNENRNKLGRPPISEVVVGISFENIFKSFEEIQNFYENSNFKSSYTIEEELRAISLEVSEQPQLTQNIARGLSFSSKDKKESIYIETDKLMFSDRNTYISFQVFIDKFILILDELFKFSNNSISVQDIGLRYNNIFRLPFNILANQFKIKSSMNIDEFDKQYAIYLNHLEMSNIQSLENENMFATVKTILKDSNDVSLQVIFDIDTHLQKKYNIVSIEEFNSKVRLLKNFKNKIFFSNFENAYDIEEFK